MVIFRKILMMRLVNILVMGRGLHWVELVILFAVMKLAFVGSMVLWSMMALRAMVTV